MNYMNKFFIDSCIFVENFKINGVPEAKAIWNEIIKHFKENEFLINLVVKNEVIFHLYSKRKLMSFQEIKRLLKVFGELKLNEKIEEEMFRVIEHYNLRPNDALILATCKHYKIKYLISIDREDLLFLVKKKELF